MMDLAAYVGDREAGFLQKPSGKSAVCVLWGFRAVVWFWGNAGLWRGGERDMVGGLRVWCGIDKMLTEPGGWGEGGGK